MLILPLNATAPHWPCTCLNYVSGLRRLEKTLNFLRCIHVFDRVLKCGSDKDEGNWLQLLLYLIVSMSIVASVIEPNFFSYVSGFRMKFSRIALWRKRLQFDSKCDLTTDGLILEFRVGKWLLSSNFCLYGLKSAKIAELLFFFEDIKFFRCLVRGVFWSVLQKCLIFFRHMILWYRLTSCRTATQLYNLSRFVVEPIFLEVLINVFDYFWKPNSLFSKFCVNCLLMLYFVYCNSCALEDVNRAW